MIGRLRPVTRLLVGVMAPGPERLFVEHKFNVGQIVELTPSSLRAAASGEYEIIQTMPAPDISSASPRYRIRSVAERHDRIAAESELTLAKGASAGLRAVPAQMQLPRIET